MNVIQPLIELQDVDDMIRELEMEEKDIPCRKAQETARLAGVNASLEIAKNQLAAMQKRIADERAEAAELREKAQGMARHRVAVKAAKRRGGTRPPGQGWPSAHIRRHSLRG